MLIYFFGKLCLLPFIKPCLFLLFQKPIQLLHIGAYTQRQVA